MLKETLVVAAIRPWNMKQFRRWHPPQGCRKVLISRKEDLTPERLRKLNPRYIFFPHWSWIIPKSVHEQFECVVFHMTDLPFGRGGSPLQNLLSRGIYRTKISALRVDGGLDTGPIYMKRALNIGHGSAHDIYKEASALSFAMMTDIVAKQLRPKPQRGKAVTFKRRTPEMSKLPSRLTMRQAYDFIRMLDAPEYPPAFVECGDRRITLRNARLKKGSVSADAEIT